MQPKTKIYVIISTGGGGAREGRGVGAHWNIGVVDPTNSMVGFQSRLKGERRFVCFIGKQSVWLLEHVTGIAATRSKGRERSWR
jgi:hypothetical protein